MENEQEPHPSTLTEPGQNVGFMVGDRMVNGWGRPFEEDEDIEEDEDSYSRWTADQLKAEVKARGLTPAGKKKSDYAAALEADDADNPEEEEEQAGAE